MHKTAADDQDLEILQTDAQTLHPRSVRQDTFRRWDEILGNTELQQTIGAFVRRPCVGQNHILVNGANRSGKTCLVHLGMQSKFCRQRDVFLNPCLLCDSCRRWLSGAGFRNGLYFNGTQSFEYMGVNCHDPGTFNEQKALSPRASDCPLILFLDEVASPAFRPIIPKLLKPMMELPITIIACCVRAKSIRDEKTGRSKPGIPADFRFRFDNIVKTMAAPPAEFLAWLKIQCEGRDLQVDNDATLELLRKNSHGIPGQALRPIQRAEFLQVPITRAFVEAFRWEPE